jgi:hypothetical protein
MKTLIIEVLVLLGALVTDAFAQRGGCAHGGAASTGGTSTTTSSVGTTGTGTVVSGTATSTDSAVARQLLQLAYQQQLQQYQQQQEALAEQEEQERQQLVAERRARLIAQRGTTLSARLAGSDKATGIVTFHTSTTNGVASTRLKIEIRGAPANSELSVSVGDTQLGRVLTDSNGAGMLILATNPKGSIQQSLPANFSKEIAAGTDIHVGALSGTWRLRSMT